MERYQGVENISSAGLRCAGAIAVRSYRSHENPPFRAFDKICDGKNRYKHIKIFLDDHALYSSIQAASVKPAVAEASVSNAEWMIH